MKKSELKEAIKAEIKSLLSEENQVGDIAIMNEEDEPTSAELKKKDLSLIHISEPTRPY